MAKIGQLYLQQGVWKGKQIVSAQWVQESTAKSVELSTEYSPAFQATGYGYLWWRGRFTNADTETIYAAGMGGQYIFIMPKIETVVVLTGSNYSKDDTLVFDIVNRFILGSIYGYPAD